MAFSVNGVGIFFIGFECLDGTESNYHPSNGWLKLGEPDCGQVPKVGMHCEKVFRRNVGKVQSSKRKLGQTANWHPANCLISAHMTLWRSLRMAAMLSSAAWPAIEDVTKATPPPLSLSLSKAPLLRQRGCMAPSPSFA